MVLAAMGCLACADRQPLGVEPRIQGREFFSTVLECVADMSTHKMVCNENGAPPKGGATLALLGQNQIKLTSTNIRYDTTTLIYGFDVTIQNLLPYAIGTRDGQSRSGLKAFFETGPTATAFYSPGGTGTVSVLNADGIQSFTRAAQPYFFYDTILAPQQVTVPKRWELRVPRSVSRVGFSVKIFTATPQEVPVPMVAPRGYLIPADSVAKLFSIRNNVYQHHRMSGPYPRNIVQVEFVRGATQEERQSAVDMIRGRVIGGMGLLYQVLIPDDGTPAPLWQAIDQLRTLPQVQDAGPDVISSSLIPLYSRSNDGPGWRRADWNLNPDSAAGSNWGAEAIAAPFAWGCETGNDSARVAVVDLTAQHSAWVGSIISRPANDQQDIAGLMWDGDVRVTASHNGVSPGAQLTMDFEAAYRDSVHVINLSWGLDYLDTVSVGGNLTQVRRLPRTTDTVDISRARRFGARLGSIMRDWELQYGVAPLYVIAAGNYRMDAVYSGLAGVAQHPEMAARVLVVAASGQAIGPNNERVLWEDPTQPIERGSNFGALVTIAAPGQAVVGVEAGGAMSTISGTSFAAPHVAGAAGLLKSFDPRLPADSIRILLLAGAAHAGRRAGMDTVPGAHTSYPLLNIYESLRLAAARPTAPMCGQRFWTQGGRFILQRDSLGTQTEELFVASFNLANSVNVMHGGKQINVYSGRGTVTYRWAVNQALNQAATAGWAVGAPDSTRYPELGANGTLLSRSSQSHDRDSTITIGTTRSGNQTVYNLAIFLPASKVTGPTFARINADEWASPPQCVQELVTVHPEDHARLAGDSVYDAWLAHHTAAPCLQSTFGATEIDSDVQTAFSPRGDFVLVVASTSELTTQVAQWQACADSGVYYGPKGYATGGFRARLNLRCRGWTTSGQSRSSELYRVDLPSGTVRQLIWAGLNAEFNRPAIREDTRELTIERRTWREGYTDTWVQDNPYSWRTSTVVAQPQQACAVTFRNIATGAVLFAPPVQCVRQGGDVGISPSRRAR